MIIALFNFNMVGFSMFLKGQVVSWEKVDVQIVLAELFSF